MMDFLVEMLPRPMLSFFCAVGYLVMVRLSAGLVRFLYNATLRRGNSLASYGAKPAGSSWALVTGASDGIGKEFALQLAKAGFNVVIMARSVDKLNAVNEQIVAMEKKCMVIPFNFNTTDSKEYDSMFQLIEDLEIRVLVNNVGVSHDIPTPFLLESQQNIQKIINVNIFAALTMSHHLVNKMKAVSKKCLVLNVSSFAGTSPQPLLSVYAASKAFLLSWSQSLAHELNDTNVDVTCLTTYFVASNMSKIKRPSFTTPTPRDYVRSALASIGNPGGSRLPYASTPYFSHGLIDWFVNNFVPKCTLISLSHKVLSSTRARALRKGSQATKQD